MRTHTLALTLAIPFLFPGSAGAFLRTEEILASSIVTRGDGICALPLHLSGAKYGGKDLEHETELCQLESRENAAICPKRRSTNPAIEYFTPPAGMTPRELEKKECVARDAKKVAKYKLSISCSYSPGILAYYHVSRALGNIGNVPASVLRTHDFRDHKHMVRRALRLLERRRNYPIYRSWAELEEVFDRGERHPQASRIFTQDMDYSWGALSRNPRGESEYNEFNGVFGRPDRLGDFMQGPIYGALTHHSLNIGTEFTASNVQKLRQLKDAADFILLDTLLSQQDRFGNIHAKTRTYYLSNGKIEKADDMPSVPEPFRAGAVTVKEMVLRDNDCGVGMAFTNRAQRAHMLEGVAHMDPDTYRYFQDFASRIDAPETQAFFLKGLQLRDSDFRRLQTNVKTSSALLRQRCESGALSLDLDLASHFGGRAPVQNCL